MEESGQVMEVIHCKDSDEIDNIPNKNGCYINEHGTKSYYRNNKLHRDGDLPAVEYSTGDKSWLRKGFRHRICGPAVEWSGGIKSWYVFGSRYSEDDYNKVISNLPLLYWKNRDRLWK